VYQSMFAVLLFGVAQSKLHYHQSHLAHCTFRMTRDMMPNHPRSGTR
jgi:hypothetical protein